MDALKIEKLNPKALQLIKGMQELKLIRVSDEPGSKIVVRQNWAKAHWY